jgi:hypothetical protein
MRKYQYCCVTPKDENELAYIVDNMEPVEYSTFVSNVDKEDLADLKQELGYMPGSLPTLKTDWAVRFGKCKLPKLNKVAYVMVHSAIEYIFY